MLAYERLEPFGSLHDEQMHGAGVALQVNMNRKKGTEPVTAGHIFPALGKALGIGHVVELKDPKAMSKLIASKIFGHFGRRRRGR
jgi:hypothetical protein